MQPSDFFKEYKASVWDKDLEALLSLYDPKAVHFDMWDRGYFTSYQQWKEEMKNWFDSLGDEKVKVEFEMVNIHESDSVAFISALIGFQAIATNGEVLRSMKNRCTLGFKNVSNNWKVVHQHISAPVSSTDLTAILEI